MCGPDYYVWLQGEHRASVRVSLSTKQDGVCVLGCRCQHRVSVRVSELSKTVRGQGHYRCQHRVSVRVSELSKTVSVSGYRCQHRVSVRVSELSKTVSVSGYRCQHRVSVRVSLSTKQDGERVRVSMAAPR